MVDHRRRRKNASAGCLLYKAARSRAAWRHSATALGLAGMLSLLGAGCEKDEWRAFAYPDRSNLTRSQTLGTHDTLEACRAEAIAYLNNIGRRVEGAFECGLNCRHSGLGPMICEQTIDY